MNVIGSFAQRKDPLCLFTEDGCQPILGIILITFSNFVLLWIIHSQKRDVYIYIYPSKRASRQTENQPLPYHFPFLSLRSLLVFNKESSISYLTLAANNFERLVEKLN